MCVFLKINKRRRKREVQPSIFFKYMAMYLKYCRQIHVFFLLRSNLNLIANHFKSYLDSGVPGVPGVPSIPIPS